MSRLRGLISSEWGQALAEMALVLPLLLLLLFGTIEFGRIFGAHLLISNLSREGARYGVVGHDDLQIENLILSRCAWLDESNFTITLTPPYTERDKGDSLGVSIVYSLNLLTPIMAEILPNPVLLSAECQMRVE